MISTSDIYKQLSAISTFYVSSLLQLPNIQSITGSDGVICVGVNVHPIDEMSVKRVGFLLKCSKIEIKKKLK